MSRSEPLHKRHFSRAHPHHAPFLGGRGPVKAVSPGGPGRAGLCHGRSPARTGGRQTEARPGGGRRRLDGVPPRGKLFGGMGAGEGRCAWVR